MREKKKEKKGEIKRKGKTCKKEEEKKKKTQRERAGEDEGRMRVLECVWRKRKRRGGDRDNVCGGGDSIKKE